MIKKIKQSSTERKFGGGGGAKCAARILTKDIAKQSSYKKMRPEAKCAGRIFARERSDQAGKDVGEDTPILPL